MGSYMASYNQPEFFFPQSPFSAQMPSEGRKHKPAREVPFLLVLGDLTCVLSFLFFAVPLLISW